VKPIRVLLVDDHQLLRDSLHMLLTSRPGIKVVGAAANGEIGVSMAADLKPDVVLMDITMPVMNGLDATRAIVREQPDVSVIILTMHSDEDLLTSAKKAGAQAVLNKAIDPDELEAAIQDAASEVVPDKSGLGQRAPTDRPADRLSPRESRVLRLIAEGSSTKEIARELGISAKTVETYRARLIKKLRTRTVQGLTRWAIVRGILVT
jgi:two-component system nitrate/nitrite response regulator NarL